jgi:hypothetical protein
MNRLLAMALVGLLLAASAVEASQLLPGNRFPITEREYFLTGVAAGDDLLLDLAAPTNQGTVTFVAPGVDLLGLVQTPRSQRWVTTEAWDKDLEVAGDSQALLYFVANAQAMSTIFTIRLYDVDTGGTPTLVGEDAQQFVTALSPTPVTFHLATTGLVLRQGHTLMLEAIPQTLNAAVLLQHGGNTPSSLHSFRTRWLDSDADGVPDSDEVAVGRNPLNANDPVASSGVDTDKDGLSDAVEATIGTDPNNPDTDGDGFGDGLEVHAGTNPRDPNSKPYDVNNNGLPDNFETNYFNYTTINPTTGPCTPGPGCVDPYADPDNDGCNNLCEAIHGTDPNNPDTDGDGQLDGDEIRRGSDPTSVISVYETVRVPEPVAAAAFFAGGTSLILALLLRRP